LASCTSTTAAAAVPVLSYCLKPATVKPSSIVIACGDGNRYITGIHWTNWGKKSAKAAGVLHWDDCQPACFSGHYHLRNVQFSATKLEVLKKNGRPTYTELVGWGSTWGVANQSVWDLQPSRS
jgi:hypothetical protein